MAELKDGLHSGTSGQLGNLITYKRNGKYFVRAKPARVKQPNTEKQLMARQRFALLQPLNALLKEVLRFGYASDDKARPAYSAAQSWNLKHAIKGVYPDLAVDYSQYRIFQGIRPLPKGIAMQGIEDSFKVVWEHGEVDALYAQDRAVLIVFSVDDRFLNFRLEAARRADGQVVFQGILPQGAVHVYLSFYRQMPVKGAVSEGDVCPSFYCGQWG